MSAKEDRTHPSTESETTSNGILWSNTKTLPPCQPDLGRITFASYLFWKKDKKESANTEGGDTSKQGETKSSDLKGEQKTSDQVQPQLLSPTTPSSGDVKALEKSCTATSNDKTEEVWVEPTPIPWSWGEESPSPGQGPKETPQPPSKGEGSKETPQPPSKGEGPKENPQPPSKGEGSKETPQPPSKGEGPKETPQPPSKGEGSKETPPPSAGKEPKETLHPPVTSEGSKATRPTSAGEGSKETPPPPLVGAGLAATPSSPQSVGEESAIPESPPPPEKKSCTCKTDNDPYFFTPNPPRSNTKGLEDYGEEEDQFIVRRPCSSFHTRYSRCHQLWISTCEPPNAKNVTDEERAIWCKTCPPPPRPTNRQWMQEFEESREYERKLKVNQLRGYKESDAKSPRTEPSHHPGSRCAEDTFTPACDQPSRPTCSRRGKHDEPVYVM